MERSTAQQRAPCSVQQKEPASPLVSAPYLDPLLVPAMARYLGLETARARAQTTAPRLAQQKVPASALASEQYSVPR